MIEIPINSDFNLKDTFECGQCFRWDADEENGYQGVVGQRVARIKLVKTKDGSSARIECIDLEEGYVRNKASSDNLDFWPYYLDFATDYGAIKEFLIEKDPNMKEIISHGEGIHLLKQDPWETLISFIISQNNHIPRIKKCIESLCALFGNSLGFHFGKEHYSFPTPEKMATLLAKDLDPIKLGYRAPYLLQAAKMVAIDGRERLGACSKESREAGLDYLLKFPGVGAKVANCMMLFALNQRDSFPLDVWMKRIMHQLYGLAEDDTKAMEAFAKEKFGPYGGIAQQYLFNYAIQQSKNK